jgi:hypothetical protein
MGIEMRSLILAVLLLAPIAARAEDPATLVLPTPVVTAMMQRLAQDPAVQILQALQGCVSLQVPNGQGAIVSHGECPAVTAALAPKAPPAPAATPQPQP